MPSLSKVSPSAEKSAQLLLDMASHNKNESDSNAEQTSDNIRSETQIEDDNPSSTSHDAKSNSDTQETIDEKVCLESENTTDKNKESLTSNCAQLNTDTQDKSDEPVSSECKNTSLLIKYP